MYYPYLRGKQFELKALREFAAEYPGETDIVPIIEPVNESMNALDTALSDFIEHNMKFAIILNPSDGDFRHPNINVHLSHRIADNTSAWIPAFLYQGDPVYLKELIENSEFNNIMLIFRTCADTDNREIMELISNRRISVIVNDFGSSIARRIRRDLINSGKNIIWMNDCFRSLKRNIDYINYEDEPFSDSFYYYRDEQFDGFSDYTALASTYVEGGALPYALVIHLTYLRSEDQIRVHRFISDTNYNQTNIAGKFTEASRKIEPFFRDMVKTNAVEELISRAADGNGYPGLGYIKKLSIKNHLELIKRIGK